MRRGRYPFIFSFLALPLLVYGGFVLWPYLQTVGYSFTDWGARSPEFEFIGVANYRQLLADEAFRGAFANSLFFFLTLPIATIALALFFAFMLNVGGRGNRPGVRGVVGSSFYRVVFFFPFVLSIAIVAVVWRNVLRTDSGGLANSFLMAVGVVDPGRPLLFLSDPRLVRWLLLAVAVWTATGFFMVLFSAAMASIPKDLFEAAMLDGAARGQQFFRITLPLLRDTVSVAWVYLGIMALDMFALVYALTPRQGAAHEASRVMATQVVETGFGTFRPGQFGYACAMGVSLATFTLILAIIQLRVLRRERIEYA